MKVTPNVSKEFGGTKLAFVHSVCEIWDLICEKIMKKRRFKIVDAFLYGKSWAIFCENASFSNFYFGILWLQNILFAWNIWTFEVFWCFRTHYCLQVWLNSFFGALKYARKSVHFVKKHKKMDKMWVFVFTSHKKSIFDISFCFDVYYGSDVVSRYS